MRGPAGYGRYDDDPNWVGCPRATSDMSPCIARDGYLALAGEPFHGQRDCVICRQQPRQLIAELAEEYEAARDVSLPPLAASETGELDEPDRWANVLARLVRVATEPISDLIPKRQTPPPEEAS